MAVDRKQLVRDAYAAFSAGDRSFYEQRLAEDFAFSAPPDPHLDRAGYFARCWPGSGRQNSFEIVRLIEQDDEVVATYETETSSGVRGDRRSPACDTFDVYASTSAALMAHSLSRGHRPSLSAPRCR